MTIPSESSLFDSNQDSNTEEKDNEKAGYLYVMYEDSRKMIKIGKSVNTPQREQQLNGTKMPMTVRLVAQVKSPFYAEAEKILHRLYDHKRVKGEWFDLDPIETACLMLLTPDHLDELVNRRTLPMRSLTELVKGAYETFMYPDEDYHLMQQNRRENVISGLHQVIRDLKGKITEYEKVITKERLDKQAEENGTENMVRNALRSLPERYTQTSDSTLPSW